MKRIATVLVLATIVFSAIGVAQSTLAQAQETTVPATEAPDTTIPNGLDESNAPWWILLIVGVGILVLIIAFATRGSSKKAVPAAPAARTWKDYARSGYASARWLYDAMGEDMAVWRGNAQFDGVTAVGTSAATSKADTWQKLDARMSSASDSLYSLEAAAPDQRSAQAAQNTITALNATRSALDARAESRFAYRTTEAGSDSASDLMPAREREVRSSRNLVEARNGLAMALTDLSTIA